MLSDERIAELARSCGFPVTTSSHDALIRLGREIMREAAEEAARVCEPIQKDAHEQWELFFGLEGREWFEGRESGAKVCAAAIRARIEVPRIPR